MSPGTTSTLQWVWRYASDGTQNTPIGETQNRQAGGTQDTRAGGTQDTRAGGTQDTRAGGTKTGRWITKCGQNLATHAADCSRSLGSASMRCTMGTVASTQPTTWSRTCTTTSSNPSSFRPTCAVVRPTRPPPNPAPTRTPASTAAPTPAATPAAFQEAFEKTNKALFTHLQGRVRSENLAASHHTVPLTSHFLAGCARVAEHRLQRRLHRGDHRDDRKGGLHGLGGRRRVGPRAQGRRSDQVCHHAAQGLQRGLFAGGPGPRTPRIGF